MTSRLWNCECPQKNFVLVPINLPPLSSRKMKVSMLEKDNQALRSTSGADSSEKESTLNTMLDESKLAREGLEKSLREESLKSLRLADQVKGLEKKLQETESKQLNFNLKAKWASLFDVVF